MRYNKANVLKTISIFFFCAVSFTHAQPAIGPYATETKTLKCDALDKSNKGVILTYPSNATTSKTFPLIAYAHGADGGGFDILGYALLFHQMASYGFVVAAHKSCFDGCSCGASRWTACNGLPPTKPNHWPEYYGETLKVIEWASNSSGDVFDLIDWSKGVGIAGHSMGGQSSANAATEKCTQQYDIRAAVLHHPADGKTVDGNIGVNISIPTASFTSSGDGIWAETKGIYEAIPESAGSKLYRNQVGFSHLEPVLIPPIENPMLATFTAAWFQIYLNGDKGEYYDLIFGSSNSSVCKYAAMKECHVDK